LIWFYIHKKTSYLYCSIFNQYNNNEKTHKKKKKEKQALDNPLEKWDERKRNASGVQFNVVVCRSLIGLYHERSENKKKLTESWMKINLFCSHFVLLLIFLFIHPLFFFKKIQLLASTTSTSSWHFQRQKKTSYYKTKSKEANWVIFKSGFYCFIVYIYVCGWFSRSVWFVTTRKFEIEIELKKKIPKGFFFLCRKEEYNHCQNIH
jgi:hypothetical protein